MSPKEFNWNADDQVTVINPTKDNFQFQVHSKLYEVAAGQKARMPGYIAWLYCYKMAQKLIQEEDQLQHWNDEGFRGNYYKRLVQSTENTIQAIVEEPEVEVETLDSEVSNEPEGTQGTPELDTPEQPSGVKPLQRKRKVA